MERNGDDDVRTLKKKYTRMPEPVGRGLCEIKHFTPRVFTQVHAGLVCH